MRILSILLCLSLPVLPAVIGLSAPADAATSPSVVLSMRGDPDDPVTRGGSIVVASGVSSYLGTPLLTTSQIEVSGRNADGSDALIDITAPRGEALHDGRYGDLRSTQSSGSRVGTGLSIGASFDDQQCNETESGLVSIDDLAATGTSITRLDIVFDLHCDGTTAGLFGELQINEPQDRTFDIYSPDYVISDTTIQWPDTDPRAGATPAVVTITNTGTTPLDFPNFGQLEGVDRRDFPIEGDTCESQDTPPGQSCTYTIGFEPSQAGVASAEFDTDPDGDDVQINLIGPSTDGTTELDIDGAHSPLTGDSDDTSTPENDGPFAVTGGGPVVNFVTGGNIQAAFRAPAGVTHPTGTYQTTNGQQKKGEGQFELIYGGSSCNTLDGQVTVLQDTVDPDNGALVRFDATFSQHCGGDSTVPVTGRIRYNASTPDSYPIKVSAPDKPIGWETRTVVRGTATPNEPITLLRAPRATSDYQAVAHTTASTAGAFAFTYRASGDYRFAARQPVVRGSLNTVRSPGAGFVVSPLIDQHGTLRPRSGSIVTVRGTANPHHHLALLEQPLRRGGHATWHDVPVQADGRWAVRVKTSHAVRLRATEATVHTSSTYLIIRPR